MHYFLPYFVAEKNPNDHTLASICSRISVGSWLESGILQGWLSTNLLTTAPTSDSDSTPSSWQLLRTLTAYIITQDTQSAEVCTSFSLVDCKNFKNLCSYGCI